MNFIYYFVAVCVYSIFQFPGPLKYKTQEVEPLPLYNLLRIHDYAKLGDGNWRENVSS